MSMRIWLLRQRSATLIGKALHPCRAKRTHQAVAWFHRLRRSQSSSYHTTAEFCQARHYRLPNTCRQPM